MGNPTLASVRTDILYRLGDTVNKIWSDAEIDVYIKEGYNVLVRSVLPFWDYDYLNDIADQALYDLPTDLLVLDRFTWNWTRLDPLTARELRRGDSRYRVTSGRPLGYSVEEDGIGKIRLWPVPSATATVDQDVNNSRIEYYLRGGILIDDLDEFDLPIWYVKYVRFYGLWKALERKGKGQDLKFAEHYKGRFQTGLERMSKRKRAVGSARIGRMGGMTRPRSPIAPPRLPWNYGKVVRFR